ncbi:MAG TPA: putative cytokinetic ring protein SteA [Clostridia bacterium]|nr:putative cytokinetic ring protein SteA [Clostridia bacterium]
MVKIIKGTARVDRRTKNLVKRLSPREIAIIDHRNLDEVAVQSLLEAKVKAIINAASSVTLDYPNTAPLALLDAGIYMVDEVGPEILDRVNEGDSVEIAGSKIFSRGKYIGSGKVLTGSGMNVVVEAAKGGLDKTLLEFVENTLQYAQKELGLISGDYDVPVTKTRFKGRHCLIVVRGNNYRKDLRIINSYIKEVKPVLIGVDGGADALLESGYNPDIIIGDMDSISDNTLKCGAEIIVHAYSDGRAPGLKRVQGLGLGAKTFAAPGTSEDIAMLLAYEKGCELIVAVGTHSNMLDFLEKGRKGMASTFLVRLKVGSILVDAKGVSKLYRRAIKPRHLAEIVLAASIPFFIIAISSPSTRELLKLIYIQFRLILGL